MIKASGLAMITALAAIAVSAPAASAQQGALTAEGPVTLVGFEPGTSGANAFTAFGSKFECPGSTFTGHRLGATPDEPIESGAEEITAQSHYNAFECTLESGETLFSPTFNRNGCDFVLGIGEEDSEHTYAATTDIVCPEGSPGLQIDAFSGQAHGFRVCRTTFGPQGPLSGLHASVDTETGRVAVTGTLTGVHAEKSGLCGAATSTEATLHVGIGFEGENESGEPTDVMITG